MVHGNGDGSNTSSSDERNGQRGIVPAVGGSGVRDSRSGVEGEVSSGMESLRLLPPRTRCHPSLPPLIPPFRYTVVEDGLYRGAYPSLKNMRFLARLRLRTVVSLIPEVGGEPTMDLREFCRDAQIRLVPFQVDKYDDGFSHTEALVAEILTLMVNPANHPLFIHCRDGAHNTGIVVMCLRRLQNWTLQAIYDEFIRYTKSNLITFEEKQFVEAFHHPVVISPRIPPWLWNGLRRRKHPFIQLCLADYPNNNQQHQQQASQTDNDRQLNHSSSSCNTNTNINTNTGANTGTNVSSSMSHDDNTSYDINRNSMHALSSNDHDRNISPVTLSQHPFPTPSNSNSASITNSNVDIKADATITATATAKTSKERPDVGRLHPVGENGNNLTDKSSSSISVSSSSRSAGVKCHSAAASTSHHSHHRHPGDATTTSPNRLRTPSTSISNSINTSARTNTCVSGGKIGDDDDDDSNSKSNPKSPSLPPSPATYRDENTTEKVREIQQQQQQHQHQQACKQLIIDVAGYSHALAALDVQGMHFQRPCPSLPFASTSTLKRKPCETDEN